MKAERIIFYGFAIVLGLMIALAVLSYKVVEDLRSSGQWIAHTQDVISELERLKGKVLDTEVSQRGYIITNHNFYLNDFAEAKGDIPGQIWKIKSLTLDNPLQQKRLQDLQTKIEEKLKDLQEVIELSRQGDRERLLALTKINADKGVLRLIRTMIDSMENEERRLLQLRLDIANRAGTQAQVICPVLVGLNVLGLIICYLWVRDLAFNCYD